MSSGAFRRAALATAGLAACTLAAPAHAADIYKPAYEPAPLYREAPPDVTSAWYIGGLVGYGLASTELNAAAGNFDFDADGAIAGGVLGWNYINNGFVIGLEGDLLGGGMEGSQPFGANVAHAEANWMLGLRGRAGYYVTPEIMLFATLGAGWADMDLTATGPGGGSASEVFSGIQYGGGAEMALNPDWSLRLDYLYTDLDAETVAYSGGTTATYDPDIHQFRGGLLLRF